MSAARIDAAASPDPTSALATSLLKFGERFTGCDVNGDVAALCKARVLRAAKAEVFDGANRLTNGDVGEFADMVCDPGGAFYTDFANTDVNVTDGGLSDAKALNALVTKHTGQQQAGCAPSLRKCKRSDMATCLLAALAKTDAPSSPFPAHTSAFEPQRTACTVVREEIEQLKPKWDELFGVAPCAAIASLMKRPSSPACERCWTWCGRRRAARRRASRPLGTTTAPRNPSTSSSGRAERGCTALPPSAALQGYLDAQEGGRVDLAAGLPPDTVLPPRYVMSMRDVMRAIKIVSKAEDVGTAVKGVYKLSLPFDALDASALDMYFYTNHPFTRNQVEEGVWNGRPLAWAVGGAGSSLANDELGTAPSAVLERGSTEDGEGDVALARAALGTMYVLVLFRCIDDLTIASPQMTSQSVGNAVAKLVYTLCKALYARPFESLQSVSRFRADDPKSAPVAPVKFSNAAQQNGRRFRNMQGVSAMDYATDRAFESVRYMLGNLAGRGDHAINMWTTHFRMMVAVAPYLSSETLKETDASADSFGVLSGHLCDLITTLLHKPDQAGRAQSGVLARVSSSAPAQIWTRPMFVVGAATVRRQLLRDALGVRLDDGDRWRQLFPDGYARATLPPFANGALVANILKHVAEDSPRSKDAQFWNLWTVALMGVYFPTIVSKTEDSVSQFEAMPDDLFESRRRTCCTGARSAATTGPASSAPPA